MTANPIFKKDGLVQKDLIHSLKKASFLRTTLVEVTPSLSQSSSHRSHGDYARASMAKHVAGAAFQAPKFPGNVLLPCTLTF